MVHPSGVCVCLCVCALNLQALKIHRHLLINILIHTHTHTLCLSLSSPRCPALPALADYAQPGSYTNTHTESHTPPDCLAYSRHSLIVLLESQGQQVPCLIDSTWRGWRMNKAGDAHTDTSPSHVHKGTDAHMQRCTHVFSCFFLSKQREHKFLLRK